MTIGIAAFGPDAGRAVVRALAAVEAVGRGAIGGFVSFVALTEAGGVERSSVQRGGSAALFGHGAEAMPAALATARFAGLMSSGPDRPEPLSQFTPAEGGIGLVSGHRLPNTIGASGINVNDEVLELMRRGWSAEDAVERVVADNPEVDAGLIAIDMAGGLHAADTAYVRLRGDAGFSLIRRGGAGVAVLHNAIQPHRPLAQLAAEVAMDAMLPEDQPDGWITFREGIGLVAGDANAVDVRADGTVERIVLGNPKFLAGQWGVGIGHAVPVMRDGRRVAVMLYEPYMVIEAARLRSADGRAELTVPIRSR